MMTIYTGRLGEYRVPADVKPFKTGGEGSLFVVGDYILKIYKKEILEKNELELKEKIIYMVNNPPSDSVSKFMAWPKDILSSGNKFVGFVMNRLEGFTELKKLHTFGLKIDNNIRIKLQVAYNLCCMVEAIHNSGYIIGDFNPKNIGYNPMGHICLFDNDSFKFTDIFTGRQYNCTVQFDGYVAPEIMNETELLKRKMIQLRKDPSLIKMADLKNGFTFSTDYFALAVHIFQLLMNGFFPFEIDNTQHASTNSYTPTIGSSSVAAPSMNDNVRYGRFCFREGYRPFRDYTPKKSHFPNYLLSMFERAFVNDGARDRPSATEWKETLEHYRMDLSVCNRDSNHLYWRNTTCPYCESIEIYKRRLESSSNCTSRDIPEEQSKIHKIGFFNCASNDEIGYVRQFESFRTAHKGIYNVDELRILVKIDRALIDLYQQYPMDTKDMIKVSSLKAELQDINLVAGNSTVTIDLPKFNKRILKRYGGTVKITTFGFKKEREFEVKLGDSFTYSITNIDDEGLPIASPSTSSGLIVQYALNNGEYLCECKVPMLIYPPDWIKRKTFNLNEKQKMSNNYRYSIMLDNRICNDHRRWNYTTDVFTENNREQSLRGLTFGEYLISKHGWSVPVVLSAFAVATLLGTMFYLSDLVVGQDFSFVKNPETGKWVPEYYDVTHPFLVHIVMISGGIFATVCSYISYDDNSDRYSWLCCILVLGILVTGGLTVIINQYWLMVIEHIVFTSTMWCALVSYGIFHKAGVKNR